MHEGFGNYSYRKVDINIEAASSWFSNGILVIACGILMQYIECFVGLIARLNLHD